MVEALSVDGSACKKLETSKVAPLSGWLMHLEHTYSTYLIDVLYNVTSSSMYFQGRFGFHLRKDMLLSLMRM